MAVRSNTSLLHIYRLVWAEHRSTDYTGYERLLHWYFLSRFPSQIPLFFHVPDCIIAAGVRDFIMAGFETSRHEDGLGSI